MGTPAIELVNITKTFGSVVANKNVCLEVRKGEILSILSENGSGKTTLMNMISGIYYPDNGQIIIKITFIVLLLISNIIFSSLNYAVLLHI